jgi:hypothetical protein
VPRNDRTCGNDGWVASVGALSGGYSVKDWPANDSVSVVVHDTEAGTLPKPRTSPLCMWSGNLEMGPLLGDCNIGCGVPLGKASGWGISSDWLSKFQVSLELGWRVSALVMPKAG